MSTVIESGALIGLYRGRRKRMRLVTCAASDVEQVRDRLSYLGEVWKEDVVEGRTRFMVATYYFPLEIVDTLPEGCTAEEI